MVGTALLKPVVVGGVSALDGGHREVGNIIGNLSSG